jgi:GTP-binding protein TrmE-like protein
MLRSSLATSYWGLSRNSSLAWSSCCLCSALLTSGAAVQSRHPTKRLPLLSSWQNSTLRAFNSSPVIQLAGRHDSTIYALSTALGRAAIAIVRISGPACLPVCSDLLVRGGDEISFLVATRPTVRDIPHPYLAYRHILLDLSSAMPWIALTKATCGCSANPFRPNTTTIEQYRSRS